MSKDKPANKPTDDWPTAFKRSNPTDAELLTIAAEENERLRRENVTLHQRVKELEADRADRPRTLSQSQRLDILEIARLAIQLVSR